VKSSSPLLSARPLLRSHFLLDVGEAKREPGSKRRARAQRAETHTQHRLDVVPVIESILYYGCVYVFKTQIIGDSWMENQIGSKPSKFFFLATHNSRRADTNSLFFFIFLTLQLLFCVELLPGSLLWKMIINICSSSDRIDQVGADPGKDSISFNQRPAAAFAFFCLSSYSAEEGPPPLLGCRPESSTGQSSRHCSFHGNRLDTPLEKTRLAPRGRKKSGLLFY
jgi:hypothetical protein